MKFLCLDFEGVLIPEIWQYVAKETNSEELMLTTQDLKNYDELMALRMKVVNEKNIKLSDIQEIVRSMNPFEGAKDFLEWAKTELSSVYYFRYFLRTCLASGRKVKLPNNYMPPSRN